MKSLKLKLKKPSSNSGSSHDFKTWFKTKCIPKMAKLGNQRHLAAIRDSFGTMIPLIIAGSIGILINAIIFGGAGSGYVSLLGLIAKASNPDVAWDSVITGGWSQTSNIMGYVFGIINTATMGMISIWFSFLFGFYISVSRNFQNPLVAGLVSGSAFIVASLGEVAYFMDAKGLITAIIFGIIATELFIKLSSVRALNIKLPDGVPPAVGKSFAVFLPVVITLSSIALINVVVLAPAIVTGDLKVTASTYYVWSKESKPFEELFKASYDQKVVVENLNSLKVGFENHTSVINDLVNKLNSGNQSVFWSWYDGLSKTDQAVVTNAVSTLASADGSGALIADVASSAKLTPVENGVIVTAQWLSVKLGPTQFGIGAAIYQFFTSWFIGFATSEGGLGLAILFAFLVSFFWFFGVHGSNIVAGIFEPIWLMILAVNSDLINTLGYDAAVSTGNLGIFTKSIFDSYMYVGGSGATLGLIIMTLSFSKRKNLKEVSKYAAPAGCFQINEPVIFGYPIILNPIYVVPFIFAPIVNIIICYIFSPAVLGFIKYSFIQTPWTAPWFVGAVITSLDPKALLPAFIVLGVDVLFYLPFVLLDNKLYFNKLKKENIELYNFEMRYYGDPEYKWNTDTQSKYDAKINKSELVISDAEELIKFWEKRMTDKTKLEARKKSIMDKALVKQEKYKKQAEELKIKRDKKAVELKPKWDTFMKKKVEKDNQKSVSV